MTVRSQRVGWAKSILRREINRTQSGEQRKESIADLKALGDDDAIAAAVAYARTLDDDHLIVACMSHGYAPTMRRLKWIITEMKKP